MRRVAAVIGISSSYQVLKSYGFSTRLSVSKMEVDCDNMPNVLESEPKSDITGLLRKLSEGDPTAHDRLFTIVYEELQRLARWAMQSERRNHTLQPTALVHEAFLRLAGDNGIEWQDRKHFFVIAAQTMRRILVDHARIRNAAKRDVGQQTGLEAKPSIVLGNCRQHIGSRSIPRTSGTGRLQKKPSRDAQVFCRPQHQRDRVNFGNRFPDSEARLGVRQGMAPLPACRLT